MTISGNRAPEWADDHQALVFGIHVPRPRESPARSVTKRSPGP